MARKGVLVNSPDVQSMTTTQWLFEYLALKRKERETFELSFKALKAILISVMGLNAVRPEDDKGAPKSYDSMTEDEREAFLPLIAWVGRPELLKMVKEQMETEANINQTEDTDDTYNKLIEQIDAADGDMTAVLPIIKDNPIPLGAKYDPLYQRTIDSMVKKYPSNGGESESIIDIEGKI